MTETKTMLMQREATNAGTAICCAPSRMAWMSGLPSARVRGVGGGGDDGVGGGPVGVDVLDLDGGVVNQDADGQRQPSERHDVDGGAERAQREERGDDGERDRDADDQRGTPAAEKEQDHGGGERGSDQALDEQT